MIFTKVSPSPRTTYRLLGPRSSIACSRSKIHFTSVNKSVICKKISDWPYEFDMKEKVQSNPQRQKQPCIHFLANSHLSKKLSIAIFCTFVHALISLEATTKKLNCLNANAIITINSTSLNQEA